MKSKLQREMEETLSNLRPTPEEEERLRQEEEQAKRSRLTRAAWVFISKRIGKRFVSASFEKSRETEAISELKDRLELGRLAFIQGRPGCGKTYAAAAWLRREILEGRSVEYIRSVDFMNKIVKKAYAFMPLESENLLEKLRRVDSLVIDDVGSEDMTPDFLVQFTALLDSRYADEKTTVILTNLPFDDWLERYGERVVSRISEWAVDNFLQTAEPDLRMRYA